LAAPGPLPRGLVGFPPRRLDAAIVASVVAVAAAFRIPRLTGYSGLTGDESFSLALAQRSLPEMFHRFTFEANGMLYALLQWPLIRIDSTLLVLRLPALVAGALGAGALYWAGSRIVGKLEAAVAAWLLAVSPFAIAQSQLARPYVFAMLFGILAYGCLARIEDDRRYWVGYVAAMALAGYSNTLAVPLLVAAQSVLIVPHRRLVRSWLLALLATALLLVPLAAFIAAERSKRDPLYWLARPTAHDLTTLGRDFFAGGRVLALAVAVVAVAAVLGRLRGRGAAIVAAWALVPIVLLFVFAQVESTFWNGYLLPALPGALLLVGSAVARLPRLIGAVALVLFTVGFGHSLVDGNPYHPHGLRNATRALVAQRAGDPVVFDIPDGLVAAGFYHREFAGPKGVVVNEWGDQPLPHNVILRDDPGGYGRAPSGPPTKALLSRLLMRTGTVFVFVYSTMKQGDIVQSPGLRWAAHSCKLKAARYGAVRLIRLRRCAQADAT
jgi:hypothetical protein